MAYNPLWNTLAALQSTADAHIARTDNPHTATKSQVSLTSVTDDAQVKRTEMGAASGVATLGSDSKVPYAQVYDVALPVAQAFTSGVAFQPNASSPCVLNLIGTLSGVLGLLSTATIAICSTAGGTFVTVSKFALLISVLATAADSSSGSLEVGKGQWVKITITGTGTYSAMRQDRV